MIQWSEKMSVGNLIIDQQHKTLVDLVNKMYDAVSKGKGDEAVKEVLPELVNYTKTHFDYEENFMKQTSYPNLAQHHKLHQDLIRHAYDINDNIQTGQFFSSVTVTGFLKDWLMNHILKEDMKYSIHNAASV